MALFFFFRSSPAPYSGKYLVSGVVEAATEDEAIEKAEEQGHRHGWLPWALSDRPSPGSPITVTEVIEDTE